MVDQSGLERKDEGESNVDMGEKNAEGESGEDVESISKEEGRCE